MMRSLICWRLPVVQVPRVVLLLLVAVVGCERRSAPEATGPAARQNLILITIDALRADHLGCYGYARDTSPRIDQLARQGTVFTQAEVQWPKTAPSIASMMTSTYCATNRVRTLRIRLDDRLLTLAEILRAHGFYTGAFVANVHLGTHFNFTQGFDDVCEMWDHREGVKTSNQEATFWSNQQIASEVVSWLRSHHRRRLFLWVHFLDPHGPYLPPGGLASRFVGDEIYGEQPDPPPPRCVPRYQRAGGHQTVGDFVAAYDAEIVSSDAAVGTLLDELEVLGLRAESLVVITADHGESLGEHDYYFEHGKYAYEACTRVPLIFYHPALIPAGRRIEAPVPLLDLAPTLLELLEVQPDPPVQQFQGESLADVFDGKPVSPRPIFIESRDGQCAVRNGRWKFIDDPRTPKPRTPIVAREQLYDLQADPMETRNLVEERPQIRQELRSLLARWKSIVAKTAATYREQQVPDETLTPDVLKQLQSLGYVGQTDGDP